MHVLVTGAGGFVGQALVRQLLGPGADLPQPLTRLTAIDQRFGAAAQAWQSDARVRCLEGDFVDPALLDAALEPAPHWVFHLASVPGSLAEREPVLGRRVNLTAAMALLDRLADARGGAPAPPRVVPRVIFASSIAVYGSLPREGRVDESCPTHPLLSYGAHKLVIETLLADHSRRGLLDGVSLRLPGIVARPASPSGHGSAFMSDMIRCLGAGLAYDCPVSADARAWWMSLPCCIRNLLHAARRPMPAAPRERCVQLPVLTATVRDVVAAIGSHTGRCADIRYRPDEHIEALFGRMPGLDTPLARRLGFEDDGTLSRLVANAIGAQA